MKTITKTYYGIGSSNESDKYYEETIWEETYHSRDEAERAIKKALKEWGHSEGNTRKDYDICKVTITYERGV